MSNPATTSRNRVTIRMYDMGFGDCFLMLFPSPDGGPPKKVLIDCGTCAKGANEISDVVRSIVNAVTDPADKVPRIDVVVGTHRHTDHVSGFTRSLWSKVEVREVWMPWTESPDDEEATRLRTAQTRVASTITKLIKKTASLRRDVAGAAAQEIASLALANEDAMNTLWHGFAPAVVDGQRRKAVRRYLNAEVGPQQFAAEVLPRVDVHVLGPYRDAATIQSLEPPSEQAFIASVAESSGKLDPFAQYKVSRFRSLAAYKHLAKLFHKRDEQAVNSQSARANPLHVAREFDSVINGTSLVLFFEFGKASLLFAGDAQWGTWERILQSEYCRDLLTRTDLYKVSHHGSHNGTPVDFVEEIIPSTAKALISVGKQQRWPGIPRKQLIAELNSATKQKVLRSDDKTTKTASWHKLVRETLGNRHVVYREIKVVC